MMDNLTDDTLLDRMIGDWYQFRNTHYTYKNKFLLWQKWIRT